MAGWRLLLFRIGVFGGTVLFLGGLALSFFVPEAIGLLGPGLLGIVIGVAIGTRRFVCPNCRRSGIQVGVNLPHCSPCGAPLDGPAA